jgi:hypothetical protein
MKTPWTQSVRLLMACLVGLALAAGCQNPQSDRQLNPAPAGPGSSASAAVQAPRGSGDFAAPGTVQPPGSGPPSGSGATPAADVRAADATAGNDLHVLRMHFDILRVDVPLGGLRHSLKVWNHIDESQGDPGLTALLARNGFRAGVGTVDDWPAIRAILERNGARVTRVARTAQAGAPMTVPLGNVEEGASYFLHRRGGGLGGGTFTAGRRAFRIGYALETGPQPKATLRVTPTFEESTISEKPVERGGEVMFLRDREGRVFRELMVEASLTPGEFLVVGGSRPAEKGYLLGSLWLESTLEMQKFETLLFVSAQPLRIK